MFATWIVMFCYILCIKKMYDFFFINYRILKFITLYVIVQVNLDFFNEVEIKNGVLCFFIIVYISSTTTY